MVALTGIAAPIGLSFVLLGLMPLSPVQAFAAGAALCSTSLGTTFTVLSTSGLTESRLGVVLSSAAMMDDVVGLIMVQIISSLGAGSEFSAITVIRPVFVSIAFGVLIPLICLFVARPIMLKASGYLERPHNEKLKSMFCSSKAAFIYQTGVLLSLITSATYAGTSNLFAAYLAGASVTWLSDCMASEPTPNQSSQSQASNQTSQPQVTGVQSSGSGLSRVETRNEAGECSGKAVYEHYYMPAVESILRPLFFASIGFAIPITRMFSAHVVWRGLVYTLLMIFAKVICGLWLIRFDGMPQAKDVSKFLASIRLPAFTSMASKRKATNETAEKPARTTSALDSHQRPQTAVLRQSNTSLHGSPPVATDAHEQTAVPPGSNCRTTANTSRKRSALPRPKSLYPAAILGSAMVARGEIGFLISSVAESQGVFGEGGGSEEFLVVTWAILLCTLIGPITVGLLVKRVKRLQQAERSRANGQEDPLGIWGVLPSSAVS